MGKGRIERSKAGKGQDLLGGGGGAQPSRLLPKNRTASLIVTKKKKRLDINCEGPQTNMPAQDVGDPRGYLLEFYT